MYSFTNKFGGSTLRERMGMMDGHRSGSSAWWRYLLWVMLVGIAALACRHRQADQRETYFRRAKSPFPLTNATRVLAAELDKRGTPWFRQSMLLEETENRVDTIRFQGRLIHRTPLTTYPEMLCLKEKHLAIKNSGSERGEIFVNGQKVPAQALTALTFEEINDLLVYQKWADMPGADQFPESYRVFISTTHKTPRLNPTRTKWKQFLVANGVSDYPLGNSSTYSMNSLLEATFFKDKRAFVKRTKNNYLSLYDDYARDIDLYINGIAVDAKAIDAVHVREVDKLYTRERPFAEWTDRPNRKHRFILYVKTTPKRAKRDSTYYVFSPFYTGDF